MKTEDEIKEELAKCVPYNEVNIGLTYEDIVRDTLEWVLGISDKDPIGEDD